MLQVFTCVTTPVLPQGYDWIDSLRDIASVEITDAQLEQAKHRFPCAPHRLLRHGMTEACFLCVECHVISLIVLRCDVLFRAVDLWTGTSPRRRRRLTTTDRFSKAISRPPQQQSVCRQRPQSLVLRQKPSSGTRPLEHWYNQSRIHTAFSLPPTQLLTKAILTSCVCVWGGGGGVPWCLWRRQALTASALGVLFLACTSRRMLTLLTR